MARKSIAEVDSNRYVVEKITNHLVDEHVSINRKSREHQC
jgi:hypothetical protein